MNADGSSGVAVSSTIGVRAGFLLPLALLMVGLGLLISGGAVALIIIGASGNRPSAPPVGPAASRARPRRPPHGPSMAATAPADVVPHARAVSPVALDARLDEPLSRWMWLVKWFLAIPHFFLLGFLWIAFSVVCVVAFFAILFTGRYPRGLFDFNLGVLQWSWRVSYYCSSGGLGTDRYPPFSLGPEPDYPARLDIAYPARLSRGLVLVKWWLLAIPHYIIVGLLVGGGRGPGTATDAPATRTSTCSVEASSACSSSSPGSRSSSPAATRGRSSTSSSGSTAGSTASSPTSTLMTDVYPPFQLDEGGPEVPLGRRRRLPPPMPHRPRRSPSSRSSAVEPGRAHRASRPSVHRLITRRVWSPQGWRRGRESASPRPATATIGPMTAHSVTPDMALPPT